MLCKLSVCHPGNLPSKSALASLCSSPSRTLCRPSRSRIAFLNSFRNCWVAPRSYPDWALLKSHIRRTS
jgi:hypothetical protein